MPSLTTKLDRYQKKLNDILLQEDIDIVINTIPLVSTWIFKNDINRQSHESVKTIFYKYIGEFKNEYRDIFNIVHSETRYIGGNIIDMYYINYSGNHSCPINIREHNNNTAYLVVTDKYIKLGCFSNKCPNKKIIHIYKPEVKSFFYKKDGITRSILDDHPDALGDNNLLSNHSNIIITNDELDYILMALCKNIITNLEIGSTGVKYLFRRDVSDYYKQISKPQLKERLDKYRIKLKCMTYINNNNITILINGQEAYKPVIKFDSTHPLFDKLKKNSKLGIKAVHQILTKIYHGAIDSIDPYLYKMEDWAQIPPLYDLKQIDLMQAIVKYAGIDIVDGCDYVPIEWNRTYIPDDITDRLKNKFNIYKPYGKALYREEIPDAANPGIRPFLDHIYYIWCKEDNMLYNYVIQWLAHSVIYPWEKKTTAIILHSDQGAGKGVILQVINKIIGDNFTKFNFKQGGGRFNSIVRNKTFAFLDEITEVSTENIDMLKELIAEPQIITESKGKDSIYSHNYVNVLIASNHKKLFNVNRAQRRYTILGLDNKYNKINKEIHRYRSLNMIEEANKLEQESNAYFNKIINTDIAMLYNYFRSLVITCDLSKPYETDYARQLYTMNNDPLEELIYNKIDAIACECNNIDEINNMRLRIDNDEVREATNSGTSNIQAVLKKMRVLLGKYNYEIKQSGPRRYTLIPQGKILDMVDHFNNICNGARIDLMDMITSDNEDDSINIGG